MEHSHPRTPAIAKHREHPAHEHEVVAAAPRGSEDSQFRIEDSTSPLASATPNPLDYSDAIIRLGNLDGIQAVSSIFDRARLEDSTAEGADFSRASFREAHLTDTSFTRAILRESVFDGAEGDAVDFRGADLRSASLKGAHFDEGDFRGADLRGADLSRGRFHSADFRGALLEGTRFDGADWTGATFDRGEEPAPARPVEEKPAASANDSETIQTLNEFLGLLPRALSGEDPAAVMASVSELLAKTAKATHLSPEQRQQYEKYFFQLAQSRSFDPSRIQQLLTALKSNSSEPPEELKAWLEPLLKAMPKGPKS